MILDTNAVSGLFAGEEGIAALLRGAARHHLPTIVVGEYRYGIGRSQQSARLGELLQQLIEVSAVLRIDLATTTFYATVREDLRRRGSPIPENDVWIAALARQHGLAIVSRDAHFDQVPGIIRHGW